MVRMTIKYLAGNRLTGSNAERLLLPNIIRDYQGTATSAGGLSDYTGWEKWQSIKITADEAGKKLKYVDVSLGKAGSPTGNVQVVVLQGSDPNASPTESSDTVNVSTLSAMSSSTDAGNLADVRFTFSSEYTLVEDDYIAITTTCTDHSFNTTNVYVGQLVSTPYRWYQTENGTSWTNASPAIRMKLVDSKNLQSGSIFTEWDSGDHYIWSGSAWNEMS